MAGTLDALYARAEQAQNDKKKTFKYKSKLLGTEIMLTRPSTKRVADIMDEVDETDTTYDALRCDAQIVYEAWSEVSRNYKDLKERYEASDPPDLIMRIFDGHLDEMSAISKMVLENSGLATDALKNL